MTYSYTLYSVTHTYRHLASYTQTLCLFVTYKCTDTCDLQTYRHFVTYAHYTQTFCLFVTYKCTDTCDLQRTLYDLQTYRHFVTYAHYTQTLCLWLMSVCDLQMYRHLWLTKDTLWLTNIQILCDLCTLHTNTLSVWDLCQFVTYKLHRHLWLTNIDTCDLQSYKHRH